MQYIFKSIGVPSYGRTDSRFTYNVTVGLTPPPSSSPTTTIRTFIKRPRTPVTCLLLYIFFFSFVETRRRLSSNSRWLVLYTLNRDKIFIFPDIVNFYNELNELP